MSTLSCSWLSATHWSRLNEGKLYGNMGERGLAVPAVCFILFGLTVHTDVPQEQYDGTQIFHLQTAERAAHGAHAVEQSLCFQNYTKIAALLFS